MGIRLRVLPATAVLALAVAGVATLPAAASAAPAKPAKASAAGIGSVTSTITGAYTDATGLTGTFTGTFVPSRFTANGSQLTATGRVLGQLTDASGASRSVTQTATLPVDSLAPAAVGCQVLDLVLGPLDLNLLGLTVHLNQVHLNITAVPGAGNLLGNLLCAVAGLLNGSGAASQIAALLNQILGLLNL